MTTMRRSSLDETLAQGAPVAQFRMPPEVFREAKERAWRERITFSEWLRRAIERALVKDPKS